MASITKHPRSKYYSARFTDAAGRRVCRSTKQTNFKKAQAVAETWEKAAATAREHELTQAASVKVLSDLMEQTGVTVRRQSIEETLRGFIEASHASEVSRRRYVPVIDGFLSAIGAERAAASVASLTPQEIESWHAGEAAKGKSEKTANFGLGIIKAALARAKRFGLLLSNPADAVRRFETAGEARKPFTNAEVAKLLKAATTEWRGMILLGAWAGVRLADAANLTWAAIDLEKRTLTFRPSKTRKLNAEPLTIALHTDVLTALSELPRGIGAAPLFPSLYGRKAGSHGGLSNEFARLMVRAGIDRMKGEKKAGEGRQTRAKSFHSLRHTAITRLADAEVSPDVRKAIAGHANDKVHARYTHLALETQRKAIERLPSLLGTAL